MSHAQAHQPLSEDDYLRQEAEAEIKHEFVGGETYAMAGASERHNRIAGNVFYHLRTITRGKTCRAFMADMKLRIAASSTYYYPDVMLVCDPADDHPIYKQAPCLIAEVLSPATASIDVREKWQAYRALPSLRYYLLVDSERLWTRVFFRKQGGDWFEQQLSREDMLEVQCDDVRLDLTLDDLYEDTGLLLV
jgi:Uma2 family endonuclease